MGNYDSKEADSHITSHLNPDQPRYGSSLAAHVQDAQ